MHELHATRVPQALPRPALRPLVRAVPRTKTSIDIMHERDTFRDRVSELESMLATIRHETELALQHAEIQPLTLCRISCIARRAVGETRDTAETAE